MGATRTIKPEFFKNYELYDLEQQTGMPLRVAYAGLWTCCDREGRFKWIPRFLRAEILPFDTDIDFTNVLDVLAQHGFIYRYSGHDVSDNLVECGVVLKFKQHQHIHNKEPDSILPSPPEEIQKIIPGVERKGRKVGTASLAMSLNKKRDVAVRTGGVSYNTFGGFTFRTELDGTNTLVKETGDASMVVAQIATSRASDNEKGYVEIGISEALAEYFQSNYTGINVMDELKAAASWSMMNPKNRKTDTGMGRFLNSWFARAQNNRNQRADGQGGYQSGNRISRPLNTIANADEAVRRLTGGSGMPAPEYSANAFDAAGAV